MAHDHRAGLGPDAVKHSVLREPEVSSTRTLRQTGMPRSSPEVLREVKPVVRRSDPDFQDQDHDENSERSVRLSVNLSAETAETFRALIKRKGLTITEGIRRAIAVWKFVEDETQRGNQIAVIERDDSIRKVVLL